MSVIIEKLKNPFVYAFLCIFLFVYIARILTAIFKVLKINTCINTLYSFVSSATQSPYGPINKQKDYEQNLCKVLKKYPDISDFTNFYSPELSYKDSDSKTYSHALTLLKELLMNRNYLVKDFKNCLNPFNTIIFVASLPSLLIQWIGFKPKDSFKKFFNLFVWILTYLLTIYGEDIKNLINSLLSTLQCINK